MKKILAHATTIESAGILRDEITKLTGTRYLVTSKPEKINDGLLFRYGNSSPVNAQDPNLNSANFIRLASNKARFSEWAQANQVYSPIYSNRLAVELVTTWPILVRSTLTGMGGAGITVCQNMEEATSAWVPGSHWTPYIPTRFELRVHILGGTIARIFRKERNSELEDEQYPIRNSDRGYHFSIKDPNDYPKVRDLVNRIHPLLAELGGKFYGLDLGYNQEEHRYLTFEINSACGLNEHTAELYAQYICQELDLLER